MKVAKGERRKRTFWAERTHTEGCSEKKQEGELRLNQREEDRVGEEAGEETGSVHAAPYSHQRFWSLS